MTIRAGGAFGDDAAPNGGNRAMGATATDMMLPSDSVLTTDTVLAAGAALTSQLQLGYRRGADGCVIVDIRGEIDIATATRTHAYLRDVVDSEDGQVTLNLAELTFCDAAGLGVLARVAARARQKGRSVQLAGVRAPLKRIMRITRLDETFPEIHAPEVATTVSCPPQAGPTAD